MGAGESEKPISERLQGFATPEEHPVKAELIAEHTAVQPGGRTRIGVLFTIREGWHIYAKEPGDAGLPTRIAWSGPEGVSFGPLVWPPPQASLDPGDIRTFGYAGTVVLSSALAVLKPLAAEARIHADVEWLACKDVCIPGAATLELVLPLRPNPSIPSPHAHLFE
jgi:thiol:disulfide interchange protein DsbD